MTISRNNWTNIEVTNDDNASDDLDNLVLDISEGKDTSADPKDLPKPAPRKVEADDDGFDLKTPAPSEPDEDLESDTRPKPNRAYKRIKNLLGERQELTTIVQKQQEIIKELSTRMKGSEKQNVSAQREQWERTVANKEHELAKAMDDNDPKALAAATRELADAQMRASAMKAVEDDFDDTPEVPELPDVTNRAPEPPEAAREWVERNPWFFKDQKQHLLARSISLELTNEGKLDPESDEYWDEIDNRLSKFNVKAGKRKGGAVREEAPEEVVEERPSAPTKRKGSPISSSRGDEDSTQFSRKGGRVTASPTQNDIDMAGRLGVDLTDYMKEKFKYSNQDYKGYVTIDIP